MKLLYKELMLTAHPTSIVFAFLGCLVVVPAYPYTVIFMFGCLAPYITFLYARETNDAWYTAVLPVTKRESVKGKCQLIVSIQLFQLLISIPCVILRGILEVENNPVGIDATVAWYGFGLIIYAVFDLVFFPAYYKNGYKAGKAFVLAAIPMLLLMVVVEGAVHIPALAWLDSYAMPDQLRQLPILLFGIVCYAALLSAAYRISVKRFERVDLFRESRFIKKARYIAVSSFSLLQKFFVSKPSHRFLQKNPGEYCTYRAKAEKNPDIH